MSATAIERFDHNNLRLLRTEIEGKLNEVLKGYGLAADLGRITFGAAEARTKLTLTIPGSAARPSNKDKWAVYCYGFGLTPEYFGRTFHFKNCKYTISGISPKSRRFPVLATNADGTEYKFPVETIKALVEISPPAADTET